MTAKTTPEELARRRENVIETLARSPSLTRHHFQRAFGYSYDWLLKLEAEGIVFGKPQRNTLQFKAKRNTK